MKRYFEYKDVTSCKFWEVTLDNNLVIVRFGKIGANGNSSEKTFDSAEKAQKECEKLIRQKTSKGYEEVIPDATATLATPASPSLVKEVSPQKEVPATAEKAEDTPPPFTPFKRVSPAEFKQNYFKHLKLFQNAKELFGPQPGNYYLVCEGNAVIEGDFRFSGQLPDLEHSQGMADKEEDSPDKTAPRIVVLGDLVIRGSLINEEEYEPLLYVKGNLYADNILSGNSHIYVNGDSHVRDVFYGYGNDGSYISRGMLYAVAYIENDHQAHFKKKNVKWKWVADNEIESAVKRKLVRSDITDLEDVGEILAAGENILATTGFTAYTYAQWLERVARKGKKLQAVPLDLRDGTMCLAAMRTYEKGFPLIPKTLKDRAFCIEALKLNARLFEYLYNDYGNDPEFCTVAVKGDGNNLRFVPVSLITKELAQLAIENRADLNYIPCHLLDEDMVCQAISIRRDQGLDGDIYIPRNFYTRRILTECIASGNYKVPHNTRPEDFYNALHLPLSAMIKDAISKDFRFIENVPDYLFSKTIYEHAEQIYGQGNTREAWEKVKEQHAIPPEKLQNPWQTRKGGLFGGYWRAHWTREFCEHFLFHANDWNNQIGELLLYIPREWITHEMAALALQNKYMHNVKYIPACALTEDMCMQILRHQYIYHICQKELYTHRVCLAGMGGADPEYGHVKGSGYSLKEIPYEMRTWDVCQAALQNDRRALPYIPEAFREAFSLSSPETEKE